jgi:tetratricopeptide (TPR) repeat protein
MATKPKRKQRPNTISLDVAGRKVTPFMSHPLGREVESYVWSEEELMLEATLTGVDETKLAGWQHAALYAPTEALVRELNAWSIKAADNGVIHFWYIRALLGLGKFEEAASASKAILKKLPQHPLLKATRAYFLAMDGEPEKAKKLLGSKLNMGTFTTVNPEVPRYLVLAYHEATSLIYFLLGQNDNSDAILWALRRLFPALERLKKPWRDVVSDNARLYMLKNEQWQHPDELAAFSLDSTDFAEVYPRILQAPPATMVQDLLLRLERWAAVPKNNILTPERRIHALLLLAELAPKLTPEERKQLDIGFLNWMAKLGNHVGAWFGEDMPHVGPGINRLLSTDHELIFEWLELMLEQDSAAWFVVLALGLRIQEIQHRSDITQRLQDLLLIIQARADNGQSIPPHLTMQILQVMGTRMDAVAKSIGVKLAENGHLAAIGSDAKAQVELAFSSPRVLTLPLKNALDFDRYLQQPTQLQHTAKGIPLKREDPKVGRNDPCPCGSGKKYKKCCG